MLLPAVRNKLLTGIPAKKRGNSYPCSMLRKSKAFACTNGENRDSPHLQPLSRKVAELLMHIAFSILRHAYSFWLFIAFYLLVMPAYSQTPTGTTPTGGGAPPAAGPTAPDVTSLSAQTILVNISETIPNFMRLVTAIAYVLGFAFVIRGIIKLKHLGESRTMMSQEHSVAQPLTFIVIGALLIYLPSAVNMGMSTFWTNPNPYGYVEQQDQWSQFINVCYLVVQFVGTVAFIRGLVILSHLSGHGGQQGLSKGLTHIIGGIFCINIYQFVQVVMATIGIQT